MDCFRHSLKEPIHMAACKAMFLKSLNANTESWNERDPFEKRVLTNTVL